MPHDSPPDKSYLQVEKVQKILPPSVHACFDKLDKLGLELDELNDEYENFKIADYEDKDKDYD